VAGFTRSFGQRLANNERVEWIKPIMFTAGVGMLDSRHAVKGAPEEGMIICKIGGPAYRIGMGGGAASSRVQGTADADLDFDAVQRGDAEMENRMNRVLRACVEMGEHNPIVSIHDQGAGGNGNVLKEIVDPLGAKIELRKLPVGDPTLSVLEVWGAEYQENNAFLVHPRDLPTVLALAQRENCPVSPVGTVTNTGLVIVEDADGSTPFKMPLSLVLGKMPQKTFTFTSPQRVLQPLAIPAGETFLSALERVFQLLDVGSKRFLTNKVDRSVTGLIAQQQCVGPLHTPLADVAVLAQSHFSTTGVAVAVGEQPIKGLISNAAQARMTVIEALSNLVFARITSLHDVKASGNWMWAAKLPGEGAKMYEACEALRDALVALGPAIDGGKDSLSMAARVGGETVKAPGELTLTCYAPCPDITLTVTPDFKQAQSALIYIDLGFDEARLGASALSTVYGQLGEAAPDLTNFPIFAACFNAIQSLLQQRILLSGHDRSDGGLVVALLEMAFAGNLGLDITLPKSNNSSVGAIQAFFSEEAGFVLEVHPEHLQTVLATFVSVKVPAMHIGQTVEAGNVTLRYGDEILLATESLARLRDVWEATSFALEYRQSNAACVAQEQTGLGKRKGPQYRLSYSPQPTALQLIQRSPNAKPRVAVLRQEGSNGDREMLSAFHAAGLEVWDVNMRDLLSGNVALERFRGLVFCGGFSYADVNDSAKGWAGVIRFNAGLLAQFAAFRERFDTFSLGVCNGCQLMSLLGWVPFPSKHLSDEQQPRFIHNASGRFESRYSTVTVLESKAVLLRGMAGSVLGVWVAHGEGRAYFPSSQHLATVEAQQLAPLRYVDDANEVTEVYPMNPNGSPRGIAGLTSPCGRHLALMPHPERCFMSWQLPYRPASMQDLQAAPWLKLFQNAQIFCESQDI
jgi:phosphoribosylformylglycinamidine synthase